MNKTTQQNVNLNDIIEYDIKSLQNIAPKYTDRNKYIVEKTGKGVIYQITNKINGKIYIGQAVCITSDKNRLRIWGAESRFKSHISEALGTQADHCRLLNRAIRKYGAENFTVKTLIEDDIDKLDDHEVKYILDNNSLVPNGYNLDLGGKRGKDSDDTMAKKSESAKLRYAKLTDDERKEYMAKTGKAQLGNRRNNIKRKYPEDNELPKYIGATRYKDVVVGYTVSGFPIGIDKPEYSKSKSFRNVVNPKDALKCALEYLEELKIKHSSIQDSIQKIRDQENKERGEQKIIKMKLEKSKTV